MSKAAVAVTLLLALFATTVVTDAAEVCQTKEKCLPIAGCVTITTAFCNVQDGETMTIEIVSDNGTLAAGDPVVVKHVTPKKGTAEISQNRLNDKQVEVTLISHSPSFAHTIHLSVYLDTGEKIGVNLQLTRQSSIW